MSFTLADILSEETLKGAQSKKQTVSLIPADKLHPADSNFYSMDDDRIKKMAASILMLSSPEKIGIQQNLVVSPIPDTDEYTILVGETRWRAVMLLLESGELDIDLIPCDIKSEDDPVRDELILILTNSTQRDRSDAEKMHEVRRLRELLEEYKKSHKLDGTVQKAIGELLGISKTKVGTLENIDRNLSPELLAKYESGDINTSVANTLAGMDADAQLAGKEMLDAKGTITAEDVRTLSDHIRETTKKTIDEEKATCGSEFADYDMTYEIKEGTDINNEPSVDSIGFEMDMADAKKAVDLPETDSEIQEAVNEECTADKHWNHPDLINDLQNILDLGCLTADTKMIVTETANSILRSYEVANGEYMVPDIDLLNIKDVDDVSIDLNNFVYDFYDSIVQIFLNVVDSSDFI